MVSKLNEDLERISQWSHHNALIINPSKSQAIYFARQKIPNLPQPIIDNTPIAYCEVVKNLGVNFDRELTWESHINQICSRVYMCLRKFYQIRQYLSQETRLQIIRSYVVPHILYGDVLFFNARKKFLKKIERAINSCTRFVFDLRRIDDISPHRNVILGCSLVNHLKIRVTSFLHKIIKFKEPSYLFQSLTISSSLRNRNLLVPRNRTFYYNSSIFVAGARIWNTIPNSIRRVEGVTTFRALVGSHFGG